jgi:hypothetical protein
MNKLGLGTMVWVALAASCGTPEVGLGDLEGEAGAGDATGAAAGSTQGADDGTGGTAEDGTGGKTPRGGSGGQGQSSTGGRSSPDGSGGKAEDATGGTRSQGGSGGGAGNGGKGQVDPGCVELSESECSMSQSCTPIYGSEDGALPGTVFAGCRPTGVGCTALVQCAYPAGAPDRCLVFSSGCVPDGWRADSSCATDGCPSWQQPGTGGTGGGSGAAGEGNAAGAANGCAAGKTFCAGVCVDVATDVEHCGSCGTACGPDLICQNGNCLCHEGLATPEEIAATPREDTNLEQLALRHSDGIVADQDVYDRIVRDVTRIRAEDADVSEIGYWPPNDGKTLLLGVDGATWDAMQSDGYSDWNCLIDSYPVENTTYEKYTSLDMYTVQIELRGIYNLEPIAAQFAELPGVSSAEPNFGIGDGPTICLTPSDAVWHYVFDQAGGDCPAGCTTHLYTYFTVSSDDGTIERVGSWGTEGSSSPAPDWVAQYASREVCR